MSEQKLIKVAPKTWVERTQVNSVWWVQKPDEPNERLFCSLTNGLVIEITEDFKSVFAHNVHLVL